MCLLLSAFEPPKLGCSIPAQRRLWLLFLWKIVRIGILLAISINKDVTVTGFPALQGTQEGEKHLQSAAIRLQPLPTVSPNLRMWKTQNTAPDSLKVKVKSLSRVWLFAAPWTISYQAPLSMGFSRQEYQSRLPFPSPGNLPNPGIKPGSPTLQADALLSEPPGKPPFIRKATEPL